jgi:hypothetical protein
VKLIYQAAFRACCTIPPSRSSLASSDFVAAGRNNNHLGITTGDPASIKAEYARLVGQIDLYMDPWSRQYWRAPWKSTRPRAQQTFDADVTGFCYIKSPALGTLRR